MRDAEGAKGWAWGSNRCAAEHVVVEHVDGGGGGAEGPPATHTHTHTLSHSRVTRDSDTHTLHHRNTPPPPHALTRRCWGRFQPAQRICQGVGGGGGGGEGGVDEKEGAARHGAGSCGASLVEQRLLHAPVNRCLHLWQLVYGGQEEAQGGEEGLDEEGAVAVAQLSVQPLVEPALHGVAGGNGGGEVRGEAEMVQGAEGSALTGRPWRIHRRSARASLQVSQTFACRPWPQETRTCGQTMLHFKGNSSVYARARVLGKVWDDCNERGDGTRLSKRHQQLLLEPLRCVTRQSRDTISRSGCMRCGGRHAPLWDCAGQGPRRQRP